MFLHDCTHLWTSYKFERWWNSYGNAFHQRSCILILALHLEETDKVDVLMYIVISRASARDLHDRHMFFRVIVESMGFSVGWYVMKKIKQIKPCHWANRDGGDGRSHFRTSGLWVKVWDDHKVWLTAVLCYVAKASLTFPSLKYSGGVWEKCMLCFNLPRL